MKTILIIALIYLTWTAIRALIGICIMYIAKLHWFAQLENIFATFCIWILTIYLWQNLI